MALAAASIDDYTVRRFEPADRDEVLALFAGEGSLQRAVEWFTWRFRDIPYTGEVPLTVAEWDGRIVALRSSLPLPLSVNGEPTLARLHADAIVHPDHRRQGLFSKVVRSDHERFRRERSTISYGTPNERSLAALARMEGVPIDRGFLGTIEQRYRIDAGRAVRGLLSGLVAVVDRDRTERGRRPEGHLESSVRRAPGGTDVVKYDDVPAKRLASMTADRDRSAVHAVRDERFYRWRMANPWYRYTTYVAEAAGEPRASVVLETAPSTLGRLPWLGQLPGEPAITTGRVIDLRPLPGPAAPETALRGLVRVLVDDTDASYLVTLGASFPGDALHEVGPRRFATSVLSRLWECWSDGPMVIAWPIDDGEARWQVNGLDLTASPTGDSSGVTSRSSEWVSPARRPTWTWPSTSRRPGRPCRSPSVEVGPRRRSCGGGHTPAHVRWQTTGAPPP